MSFHYLSSVWQEGLVTPSLPGRAQGLSLVFCPLKPGAGHTASGRDQAPTGRAGLGVCVAALFVSVAPLPTEDRVQSPDLGFTRSDVVSGPSTASNLVSEQCLPINICWELTD